MRKLLSIVLLLFLTVGAFANMPTRHRAVMAFDAESKHEAKLKQSGAVYAQMLDEARSFKSTLREMSEMSDRIVKNYTESLRFPRGPPVLVAGPPVGQRIAAPTPVAAGGTVLFLDETGLDSAAGAWSTARKLDSSYAGQCIRIRRSSDNAEQDIGFSGDEIDTASITTFCSGTDGFVVTIYDQSGNSRNITQSTASSQPQIVSSGTIFTGANGKPECRFDGSNDMMISGSFTLSNPVTHFMVGKQISWTSGDRLLDGRTLNEGNIQQSGTSPGLRFFDGASGTTETDDLVVGTPGLMCAIANGASSTFSINNGSDFTGSLGTTASGGITLAATAAGGSPGNLGFQELISYAADKTANRTTARNNINAFYALW